MTKPRLSIRLVWEKATRYLGDKDATALTKSQGVTPFQRGLVVGEYLKFLESEMKSPKP